MARPQACGAGVGADEFVAMLRHLAEASSILQRRTIARAPARASQPDFVAAGRLRLSFARMECAMQSVQDVVGALSVLLCLMALRSALHLVALGSAAPCRCCGSGRGAGEGQLDKVTSLHWTITNIIVQLQGLRKERQARQRAVFDFLSRQQISSVLSIRVRRHADRSGPEQLRESNAEFFRRVSTELLVDMLEEMRVPPFSGHPFFVNLRAKHPHLVRELCHEALQPMLKSPDEIVFSAGEVCSRMYVVINGHVQYCANVQQRDGGAGPAVVRRTLHGGQWLSEAALWTGWVHRGELRAVTDCLLFALDASGFARVISSHKSAHAFAAAYARKFVEGLNRGLQTDLVEAGPVDA